MGVPSEELEDGWGMSRAECKGMEEVGVVGGTIANSTFRAFIGAEGDKEKIVGRRRGGPGTFFSAHAPEKVDPFPVSLAPEFFDLGGFRNTPQSSGGWGVV